MANYILTKNGSAYIAHSCSYSDEYADEACALHLRTEFVPGADGRVTRYYRLHARQPHNIESALAYNILCPDCKAATLKVIGRCVNSKVLGLYECPVCGKH